MSNKKVGIITLHGYKNYGNRLQNYALKAVLEEMGCEVHTVIINNNTFKKNIKKIIKKIITKGYEITIPYLKNENINNKERTKIFESFSKENLNEKFYTFHNESDYRLSN